MLSETTKSETDKHSKYRTTYNDNNIIGGYGNDI